MEALMRALALAVMLLLTAPALAQAQPPDRGDDRGGMRDHQDRDRGDWRGDRDRGDWRGRDRDDRWWWGDRQGWSRNDWWFHCRDQWGRWRYDDWRCRRYWQGRGWGW
jgi:hypothetical protein